MPETSLVPLDIQPPPAPVDPEATDNALLRFVAAPDLEVLEARVHLVGGAHTANLAGGANVSSGTALIDLGGLRPITRINFARSGSPSKLMIQLGGTWFLPAPAGGVATFEDYAPNTPFPELVTEKALLSRVASVSTVESVTFPTNVALRLADGGVPFFFLRAALRESGADVPDFGSQLALALRSAEPVDGMSRVDMFAHSDTLGSLTVDQAEVSFRIARGLVDGVAVDARTCSVPGALNLALPPGLHVPTGREPVSRVALSLEGQRFGPSFAPALHHHGAVVAPAFQVAQPVDVADALTVTSVSFSLLRRASGPLTVEVRRDVDGEPRGSVLATASVPVDALPGAAFAPLDVPLTPPLAIDAGVRIWLVLRSDQADVEWAADDTPADRLGALVSLDRGNTWQPHPFTTTYTLLLALGTPSVTLKFAEAPQTLTLEPAALPVELDAGTPLVQDLNAALTDGRQPGDSLPEALQLAIAAIDAPGLQVTLVHFDVTFDQTLTANLGN